MHLYRKKILWGFGEWVTAGDNNYTWGLIGIRFMASKIGDMLPEGVAFLLESERGWSTVVLMIAWCLAWVGGSFWLTQRKARYLFFRA